MPGVVGIFNIQEKSNINLANLISRMCKVIKHKNWFKVDQFIDESIGIGRVSLGIVNPEKQPIFNEDKSLFIVMEGEIFDYQELQDSLIEKGHIFCYNNDPEFVLHLFEEYGEKFASKLNGTFIIVIGDVKNKKLFIINDRIGTRPFYYTLNNGCLIFASEVKAILEDETFKRIVNDEAIFDFFMRGYLLGNKTLFQGIMLLPPASIMICHNNEISIEEYWELRFQEDPETFSEDYYIETLGKLFLQAIKRQMSTKHRLGVSLSGGIDSRTIVASMRRNNANLDFITLTFGENERCDDAKFAYAVSKRIGVKNYFFKLSPDSTVDLAENAVYLTDGMVCCSNVCVALDAYEKAKRIIKCNIDCWMAGDMGDEFLSRVDPEFFDIESDVVFRNKLFEELHRTFSKQMLQHLFKKSYYSENIHLAKKSFLNSLKSLNDVSENKYIYYKIRNSNRRWIFQSHEVDRMYWESRTPFCDNDLVDFLLKIPSRLRLGAYLYQKTLKKWFPKLANVPWQRTGLLVDASALRTFLRRQSNRFQFLFYNLLRKFSKGHIDLHFPSRDFYDYDKWLRSNKRLKNYFLDVLLDKRTLSRKYFNLNYIKKLIELHMSGKENYSKQLAILLTFELWHREFIDKKEESI